MNTANASTPASIAQLPINQRNVFYTLNNVNFNQKPSQQHGAEAALSQSSAHSNPPSTPNSSFLTEITIPDSESNVASSSKPPPTKGPRKLPQAEAYGIQFPFCVSPVPCPLPQQNVRKKSIVKKSPSPQRSQSRHRDGRTLGKGPSVYLSWHPHKVLEAVDNTVKCGGDIVGLVRMFAASTFMEDTVAMHAFVTMFVTNGIADLANCDEHQPMRWPTFAAKFADALEADLGDEAREFFTRALDTNIRERFQAEWKAVVDCTCQDPSQPLRTTTLFGQIASLGLIQKSTIIQCVRTLYTQICTYEHAEALHVLMLWGIAEHLPCESLLCLLRHLSNLLPTLAHIRLLDLEGNPVDFVKLAVVVRETRDIILDVAGPSSTVQ
ncbi:hypothetical protein CYLTODRAFT_274250 [Cylindrobasidium torrendii FP15055 ss-10]|uniref:Uncharacterized protein n=1 Tax=Cylindrobasidium torrendii FP15055 ss-10 TaxID=1314674 RepID=A0A0D7BD00_9AGAR|nr:hypothetical protein CYLTODRAFT_274250 [Cylindrobasidium torrendii FP15055 ss-10]